MFDRIFLVYVDKFFNSFAENIFVYMSKVFWYLEIIDFNFLVVGSRSNVETLKRVQDLLLLKTNLLEEVCIPLKKIQKTSFEQLGRDLV